MTNKRKIATGVGAGLAAAAAAGYYFYGSKNAENNRRIAAKWAGDLKKDVLRRAKKLEKLDRRSMNAVVAAAASAYETVRGVRRDDIETAARELRNNWQALVGEMKKAARANTKKHAPKRARTGAARKRSVK